eukprot:c2100_g1_i1.p1 GENE.c2100_g1_i1~~c2100_g1_i1.p1  ORF type:complete len:102 (+),score=18.00 c2100_g1_i1:105-410(+)
MSVRPVYQAVCRKLQVAFTPAYLNVVDESYKHAGHSGNPTGVGETHFRVEMISSSFEGLKAIERHRLVYQTLNEELSSGVHALQLSLRTPTEQQVPPTTEK